MAQIRIHNPIAVHDDSSFSQLISGLKIDSKEGANQSAWTNLLRTPPKYLEVDEYLSQSLEGAVVEAAGFLERKFRSYGLEIDLDVWGPYRYLPDRKNFPRANPAIAVSRRRAFGIACNDELPEEGNALDILKARIVHELSHAVQYERFLLGLINGRTEELSEIRGAALHASTRSSVTGFRIFNELAATIHQHDFLIEECGWTPHAKSFERTAESSNIPQSLFDDLNLNVSVPVRARYVRKNDAALPQELQSETGYHLLMGEVLGTLEKAFLNHPNPALAFKQYLFRCVYLGEFKEFYGLLNDVCGTDYLQLLRDLDPNPKNKNHHPALLALWNLSEDIEGTRKNVIRQRIKNEFAMS